MTEAPSTGTAPKFKIPLEVSIETALGLVTCRLNETGLEALGLLYENQPLLQGTLKAFEYLLLRAGNESAELLDGILSVELNPEGVRIEPFYAPGLQIGNLVGGPDGGVVVVEVVEFDDDELNTEVSSISTFGFRTQA